MLLVNSTHGQLDTCVELTACRVDSKPAMVGDIPLRTDFFARDRLAVYR